MCTCACVWERKNEGERVIMTSERAQARESEREGKRKRARRKSVRKNGKRRCVYVLEMKKRERESQTLARRDWCCLGLNTSRMSSSSRHTSRINTSHMNTSNTNTGFGVGAVPFHRVGSAGFR